MRIYLEKVRETGNHLKKINTILQINNNLQLN